MLVVVCGLGAGRALEFIFKIINKVFDIRITIDYIISVESNRQKQTKTKEQKMKINMTTKTNKISGFLPVCIVVVDGGYRGRWVDDLGYDADASEIEDILEKDADVLNYSVSE